MQNGREDLIRNRAYELWEQEGHKEGQPEDYWYRAEQELGGADTGDGATVAGFAGDAGEESAGGDSGGQLEK